MYPKLSISNKFHHHIPSIVRRIAKRMSISFKNKININRHGNYTYILTSKDSACRMELEVYRSKKRYIKLFNEVELYTPVEHNGQTFIDSDITINVHYKNFKHITKRHVFDSEYSKVPGDVIRVTTINSKGVLLSAYLDIGGVHVPEYELGYEKLDILSVQEGFFLIYCPKYKKYLATRADVYDDKDTIIVKLKEYISSCESVVNNSIGLPIKVLNEYIRTNDVDKQLRACKAFLEAVENHQP